MITKKKIIHKLTSVEASVDEISASLEDFKLKLGDGSTGVEPTCWENLSMEFSTLNSHFPKLTSVQEFLDDYCEEDDEDTDINVSSRVKKVFDKLSLLTAKYTNYFEAKDFLRLWGTNLHSKVIDISRSKDISDINNCQGISEEITTFKVRGEDLKGYMTKEQCREFVTLCDTLIKIIDNTRASLRSLQIQKSEVIMTSPTPNHSTVQRPRFDISMLPNFDGREEDYLSFKTSFEARMELYQIPLEHQHIYLSSPNVMKDNNIMKSIGQLNNISLMWERLDSYFLSDVREFSRILERSCSMKKSDKADKAFLNAHTEFKTFIDVVDQLSVNNAPIDLAKLTFYINFAKKCPQNVIDECSQLMGDMKSIDLGRFDAIFSKHSLSVKSHLPSGDRGGGGGYGSYRSGAPRIFNVDRQDSSKGRKCYNCSSESHHTYQCEEFLKLSTYQKKNLVIKNSLCFLCLRKHRVENCPYDWVCGIDSCDKRHSRHLHESMVSDSSANLVNGVVENLTINTVYYPPNGDGGAHFPMQLVQVGNSGVHGRIFWDGGANSCLITHDLAQRAGLQALDYQYNISTAGSGNLTVAKAYSVPLLDRNGNTHVVLAAGCDKISNPMTSFSARTAAQLFDLDLVDFDDCSGCVELLLGVTDMRLFPREIQRKDNCILYKSILASGYCVCSCTKDTTAKNSFFTDSATVFKVSAPLLAPTKFLDSEDLGIDIPRKCQQCMGCKECDSRATTLGWEEAKQLDAIERGLVHDPTAEKWTAHYVYAKSPNQLVNNHKQALGIYHKLKDRLLKRGEFEQFNSVFKDSERRGVFTPLTKKEESYEGPTYFVSLTEAYKPESETTPLRICVNSSLKNCGLSLNCCLIKGPSGLNKLFNVTVNFRSYVCGCLLDISKFYNSVKSCDFDAHLRRVLWSEDPEKSPQVYCTRTVNFGDKCGGITATTALRRTAEIYKEIHPEAARKLRDDIYVDDVPSGGKNRSDAISIVGKMAEIARKGGFSFKDPVYSGDKVEPMKVLGLVWSPENDTLSLSNSLNFTGKFKGRKCENVTLYDEHFPNLPAEMTIRQVWRMCMGYFDPLGLLAPFLIRLKLIMKDFHVKSDKGKINWNSKIDEVTKTQLSNLLYELDCMEKVTFPRSVSPADPKDPPELIIFSDGSSMAVCTMVYIRWQISAGYFASYLISCKCRVAPIKEESIPRLELLSALLAVRLSTNVAKAMDFKFTRTTFFMDSTAALAMIASDSGALNVYGAHRVGEIKSKSDCSDWLWIPTSENIADIGTRNNTKLSDLGSGSTYQNGPKWLGQDRSLWPSKPISDFSVPKSMLNSTAKTIMHAAIMNQQFFDPTKYRSFKKAIGVFRFVILALYKFRQKRLATLPSLASTFEVAKKYLISVHQAEERESLQSGQYNNLGAFLVDEDIAFPTVTGNIKIPIVYMRGRGGGGIEQVSLGKDRLPLFAHSSKLGKLILYDAHTTDHLGPDRAIARSRENAWVVRARSPARWVCNQCPICRLNHASAARQIMAPINPERVGPCQPFSCCTVDLFGPYQLADMVKKRTKLSTWGTMFVCNTTRAVYLDVIESYSTDSFLLAMRRFQYSHGTPSLLISDAGSQLKAAKEIMEAMDFSLVQEEWRDSTEFCWNVAPTAAHHFVGQAEVFIRETKKLLQKSLSIGTLNWSEFQTVLKEISWILNSRPLTSTTSEDSSSLDIITPLHLLGGRASTSVPDVNRAARCDLTKRLRHIAATTDLFWQRWHDTVLPSLLKYSKWALPGPDVKVGDLVLVRGSNPLKRLYQKGIIVQTLPGRDGRIRRVVVKYKITPSSPMSETEMSVHNVCVLRADQP